MGQLIRAYWPAMPRLPIAVNLASVDVFIGGFLGAMLVFFFSSLTIRAVGRAAGDIIEEVRRQFREHPGIMAGTVQPGLRSLRGHHDAGRPRARWSPRASWPSALPIVVGLRAQGRGRGRAS